MLDPATSELRSHSPGFHSTFQIPVDWNPEAQCERLDPFLSDLLAPDDVDLLLAMVGYFCVPDVSVKRLFIFEGPANTGKTAALSLITALLGARNVAIVSLQDLANNRFAQATLENKLLAAFDDLDSRGLRSSSVPKVLTGKWRSIRIERKGRDAYSAPHYARLLFTCNQMPRCSTDHSDAWYTRPLIFPFGNAIPAARQEVDIITHLTESEALERLLWRAVCQLRCLIQRGMAFPDTKGTARALRTYRRQTDTVAAFLEEGCARGSEYRVKRTAWLESYVRWCADTGQVPSGRNTAYRQLRDLGGIGESEDQEGNRMFTGLRLA